MNTNYSNNVSFGSMFYLNGGLESNIKKLLPTEIIETAKNAGVDVTEKDHVKITVLSKFKGITFISVSDNLDKFIPKALDKLGCLDVNIHPCSDEYVRRFY